MTFTFAGLTLLAMLPTACSLASFIYWSMIYVTEEHPVFPAIILSAAGLVVGGMAMMMAWDQAMI